MSSYIFLIHDVISSGLTGLWWLPVSTVQFSVSANHRPEYFWVDQ